MKRLAMMALLTMALAGCKEYECVARGPVDVPDYTLMPQFLPDGNGGQTMIMTPIYIGSHKEIGCVEWREKKKESK